ncbi:aminotransferase class V-fold PLP-dependent enzyme [Clostridium sp. SHJSY1]|uniref:aminotransferase class V-fold PLP-dependent enzyme n=1 Tax=Clostridium sp. SHJSY1 TaxID=2942483 RepID=UPI00287492B6|nr:aminotransferase class V-fold PLP-dependent enzyme [Clostridium sp. SHJSY1]MDS0527921.1 aminotransferase class V-fold PLP-dependent enzyme [Clostridium sp. SHJSY1]
MNIYLDNASTSFPKPKSVVDSIYDYLVNVGGNANRSNYSNSLDSSRKLLSARENIADFFNFNKAENVIFTNNITSSLNMLIRGTLTSGDHVITSTMEHNSVLRPLNDLKQLGIDVDFVQANNMGFIIPEDIENMIKPNTKMCIISHASNVTGSIQNIKSIGSICCKYNIFFIIDSAQSAGVLDIDINEINASAIAFTGHKSLFGPQGIGGFIIDDKLNSECSPTFSGGTGSLSYSLEQPTFLPDKFESGTMNMPGIVGLSTGIDFIKNTGINTIKEKVSYLRSILLDGILNIKNFEVYGDLNNINSTTCLSINNTNLDPSELSYLLDINGIKTRSGLHCAPLAHKSIGTYPAGAVRLSLSYFNSKEDIYNTLNILNKVEENL